MDVFKANWKQNGLANCTILSASDDTPFSMDCIYSHPFPNFKTAARKCLAKLFVDISFDNTVIFYSLLSSIMQTSSLTISLLVLTLSSSLCTIFLFTFLWWLSLFSKELWYIVPYGISLLEEGGTVFNFEGTMKKCSLKTVLRVHSPQFYWKVCTINLYPVFSLMVTCHVEWKGSR